MKSLFAMKLFRGNDSEPACIEASGTLDALSASSFKTVLHSFIEEHTEEIRNGTPIVLDLHELEFMDCDGLGAIVSGYNRMKELNPKGTVIHTLANKTVAKLFVINRLDQVLNLQSSPRSIHRVVQENTLEDPWYWKNPCSQAI